MRSSVHAALGRVPALHHTLLALLHPVNRGVRWAAVKRTVSYEVRTGLLGRPSVVPIGYRSRLVAYASETNSPHAVMRNPPNWPEMEVWQRWLRAGDLFVDVGANIGTYTILAAERGAEVVACEPDARNASRVREHLALNGYEGTVVERALTDDGRPVRITAGLDSLNHLVLDGSGRGRSIESTRLDDIIGARTAAGVKIDVEGAERLVLAGGHQALADRRIELIQVEWSDYEVDRTLGESRAPLADLLRDHGYRLYRALPDGTMREYAGVPDTGRHDVFASPLEITNWRCPPR